MIFVFRLLSIVETTFSIELLQVDCLDKDIDEEDEDEEDEDEEDEDEGNDYTSPLYTVLRVCGL